MDEIVLDDEDFDWDSDGEIAIQSPASSSTTSVACTAPAHIFVSGEAYAAGPFCSASKLVPHFVKMGFSKDMVTKAIDMDGEGNIEAILETLLTYSVLEKSPQEGGNYPTNSCSSEIERGHMNLKLSDMGSLLENEEMLDALPGEEKKLLLLVEMGFTTDEAASAMDRCGGDAPLIEIIDSIYAAQIAKSSEANLGDLSRLSSTEDEVQKLSEGHQVGLTSAMENLQR